MGVAGFDHVAIPGERIDEMIEFYKKLGFGVVGEDDWRAGKGYLLALTFGNNKINVHFPAIWTRESFTLRGPSAKPGCGDFCFVWDGDLQSLKDALTAAGAPIEEGPVERQGGRGGGLDVGTSIYTRDPDMNLLEFIVYQ